MSKVTLEDIHECLIGNKLAGQKGIISTIDELVENQTDMNNKVCKMDDRQCIMQNNINTLMLDRDNNKNKISFKIPKWASAVFGIMVKTKTGM